MGSGGSKNNLADPTVNLERRLSHVDTNPPPTSDILIEVRFELYSLRLFGFNHLRYKEIKYSEFSK